MKYLITKPIIKECNFLNKPPTGNKLLVLFIATISYIYYNTYIYITT